MLPQRTRFNEKKFSLLPPLSISVSHRNDEAGQGICISLFCKKVEIMRFDLFDKQAHYHFNQDIPSHRIFIREASMEDKLDRAFWEIAHNWGYAVMTCYDANVRNQPIQMDGRILLDTWGDVTNHVAELLKR